MNTRTQLNWVMILMVVSALLMLLLAIVYANWAPAVTGLGFLVTAWGFKLVRDR